MRKSRASRRTAFKLAGIALAGILVLLAAGSRSYIELHDRLIIQGIGIDRTNTGYRVSLHALKTTEVETVELLQTQGDTLYDALDNLSLQIGKIPLYTHNIMVVIGYATAEGGLQEALDFFVRYHETRPTQSVFLAANTAAELFEHRDESGQYTLLKDIDESAQLRQINSRLVQTEVLDVVNALYRRSNAASLPMLGLKEDQIQEMGTGIFEGERLKAVMDLEQSRGMMAVRNKLKAGDDMVELPGGVKVTLEYLSCKSDIRVELVQERPVFTVAVACRAEITQMNVPLDQQLPKEAYPELERLIAEKLSGQLENAIQFAVLEQHCDVFGFGNALLHQQTGYWLAHEADWVQEMAQAEYRVQVQAEVSLEGMEVSPEPFSVW